MSKILSFHVFGHFCLVVQVVSR